MAISIEVAQQYAQLQQTVAKIEAAERIYARMEAAGIRIDADTKNRILYNLANVVDSAYIYAQKAFSDTTSNSDALDLLVEKHFDEIIGFIETREFDITTSRSDSAVVSDLKQLALTHPEQDTYSVSETNSWLMDKGQSDAASAVDAFARQVTFERLFSDVVAVDDVMNIDKLWDSTKGNVTFINDLSTFLLTRPVANTVPAIDSYDLYVAQLKNDAITATDASTVIHYLGAGQLFNRPLFNQTTFG